MEYISLTQAARLIGVSRDTLNTAHRRKRLKTVMIANRPVTTLEWAQRWQQHANHQKGRIKSLDK